MKRMTAFLLALIITVSCFTISAFAGSETYSGTYNGYSYTCSGTVNSSSLSLYMYYGNASQTCSIKLLYFYYDTYGHYLSKRTSFHGNHAIYGNPFPSNLSSFDAAEPSFYIGATPLLSFVISA